jgi:hypothetical protein
MTIVGTKMVSEPVRVDGRPAVLAWLHWQAVELHYMTATSLADTLSQH